MNARHSFFDVKRVSLLNGSHAAEVVMLVLRAVLLDGAVVVVLMIVVLAVYS